MRRLEPGGDDSGGLWGRIVRFGRQQDEVEDLGGRCAYVEIAVWGSKSATWSSGARKLWQVRTPYFNTCDARVRMRSISGQRQVRNELAENERPILPRRTGGPLWCGSCY